MTTPVRPPAATPPPPSSNQATQTTPRAPRRGGSARTRMLIAVGLVAVLALVILLVAVFAAGRNDESRGTGARSEKDHSISAEQGDRKEATLNLVSGAETVVIRAANLGGDLYRAVTPKDGSLVPEATMNGDTVQLSLVASGSEGAASAEIMLSNDVLWHLKLAGGGLNENVDFSLGKLAGLELGNGAGQIELSLPAPKGTLNIQLTGGAGQMMVHAPKGAPFQVKIPGGAGAGTVTIDGQTKNGVAPGGDVTQPDWNKATDRYVIEATVGISSVVVDRR